jgi:hypothetical protein
MKFGKQWTRDFLVLPVELQSHAINYIAWKKATRESQINIEHLERLERDIVKAGLILSSHRHSNNCCFTFCFKKKKIHPITTDDIKKYMELNAITLRKLCKRLDKRLHVGATQWLRVNAWRFDICSPLIKLKVFPFECPICLDTSTDVIVTDCSHVFCTECVRKMILYGANEKTHVHSYHVEIEAIICYARSQVLCGKWNITKCPICRLADPFRRRPLVRLTG